MPAAPAYTVVTLTPHRAHLRFAGRFAGRPVTWDATVLTLGTGRRGYIEIGRVGRFGRALCVALPLATLDAPTLAKTVIMIRNFKRLRRGHMEFGETPSGLARVIAGGQTGVDRAALDAAMACGIAVGGFCPKGRRAEDGPIPSHYPLLELPTAAYPLRTRRNVETADATLILTRGPLTGGTAYTAHVAARLSKPVYVVDLSRRTAVAPVRRWLATQGVRVLNVAGPRESRAPGIAQQARRYLRRLWTMPAASH